MSAHSLFRFKNKMERKKKGGRGRQIELSVVDCGFGKKVKPWRAIDKRIKTILLYKHNRKRTTSSPINFYILFDIKLKTNL